MTVTITFTTADQATYLAEMPQLAGNGHNVQVDGPVATLGADALAVLADLPDDHDGHYDGTYVWVGGSEYRVQQDGTGMIEAVCARCGRTFIPDGPDDLEHLEQADGQPCGGTGVITGEWIRRDA